MNRAAPVKRARAGVLLLVASGVVLAACGSNQQTGTPSRTAGPTTPGDSAVLAGPPSFGAPASEAPGGSTPLMLDSTLLPVLPASIDETPVREDLDVVAEALRDPNLPRIASGIDAAVAVDTSTGNLVTAWIVKLRPGAFGDEAYRQWRDSYDEGACNAAGGIVGRAQATLGGRETYVTSCVASLRTYHVWLQDRDLLVSASSLGPGRYGEKLLSNLRPDAIIGASPGVTP